MKFMLGGNSYQEVTLDENNNEVIRYVKDGKSFSKDEWEEMKQEGNDSTGLYSIEDESLGISTSLETIDGGLSFFANTIRDIEENRDGMATLLKAGELEKQLNAIYTLLLYELRNIEESNKSIEVLIKDEQAR